MSDAAWNNYFRSFADDMDSRWDRAVVSYKTLKAVRQKLGLGFYGSPGLEGEVEVGGAWDASLDQDAVNLRAMVEICTKAFREAAENKRKVQISDGNFLIERLPSDTLMIRIGAGNKPVLTTPDGIPQEMSGTIGIAWGAVALAGAIVTAAHAYVVVRAIGALEEMAEQKTQRTIAEMQVKLVESGKATPEQAKALTDSIYEGAATLQKEKAKRELARGPSPERWSGLVKTVGLVGLLLMGGYVAVKYLPAAQRASA